MKTWEVYIGTIYLSIDKQMLLIQKQFKLSMRGFWNVTCRKQSEIMSDNVFYIIRLGPIVYTKNPTAAL